MLKKIKIAYFCKWTTWSGFWSNIKQLFYIPKRAFQRMKYGICYLDIWNLNSYIAEIVANGTEHLSKYAYGYPGHDEVDTPEKWKNILNELSTAARDYVEEPWNKNNLFETKEQIEKALIAERENYNKYITLLTKYYCHLWD